MKKLIKMFLPVLLLGLLLAGCSNEVEENKPLDEVQTEAQSMTNEQLQSMVQNYENAIQSLKKEVEDLNLKLQDIPVTDMLGDEAKAIKDEVSSINDSVKALRERMNVYLSELNN